MDIAKSLFGRPALLLVSFFALWSGQASGAVAIRVEASPVADPIQVFVDVTDSAGAPVSGLTAADFTVLVDNAAISSPAFSLPAAQDPNRHVSVVFAMDMSNSVRNTALQPMQDAVTEFINSMTNGDYAAIVMFNESNPSKASVVQPFTQIDHAAGTSALLGALMTPYTGSGSNVLDGVALALQQLAAPPSPLPTGPKAVVLVSDGRDNASTTTQSAVLASANQASVPIFTVGVGDVTTGGEKLLSDLASNTGATYLRAPTNDQISDAYRRIQTLLLNEYLLTFSSSITDCNSHKVEVTVTGQSPVSTNFARCTNSGGGGGGGGDGGIGGGGGGSLGLLDVTAALALFGLARRRTMRVRRR